MMKYEYINTGIEWIGEIPKHWMIDRIKDTCDKIVGGGTPTSSDSDNFDDGEIVWLTPTDFTKFKDEKFISDSERKITQKGLENSSTVMVPKDTVVMSSRASIGDVKIAAIPLCTNQGFINFIPSFRINNSFLFYLIKSYLGDYFKSIATGTTYGEITKTEAKQENIPLPPKPEQIAIANYLDKTCADIDRVVEIKRKQIDNLRQQLKSVIHHTVTKGLDKNAEMKESDIDWIGKVPKYWRKRRIKDIVHLQSGDNITSEQITEEDEFPVYGGNGLRGYFTNYTHEGDFILIGRQGALCGNINYATGKFWASEHAVVATPIKKVSTIWLGEIFRTMNLNQYSNSAAQPGLSVEKIKNLYFVVPPFEEQEVIANYISNYMEKTKVVRTKIEKQIEILITYKKSLIHEVVTGKKQVYGVTNKKAVAV